MKKKSNKSDPKSRIGISVEININDDIGTIISTVNPHDFHSFMKQSIPQEENELAQYIARTLEDMEALPLHLKIVRKHPTQVIMQILQYVMNKPRKDITSSRAAYYNYLIGLYERTGKSPRV